MVVELPLEVYPSLDGVFLKIIQPISGRVCEVDQEVLNHEVGVQSRCSLHGEVIVV